jgi:hypothetical protein
VREIAEALQMNFDESQSYLNLTTQEVGMWVSPALVGDDCQWPNEGDEVIRIDTLPSRESFQAMAEFADKQPEKIADKLYQALNGSRPFARFKAAVDILDLLQDWYAFKDEFYKRMAEKWMHYYEVDFREEKIVTNSDTLTWYNEDEEDDGEYQSSDGEYQSSDDMD